MSLHEAAVVEQLTAARTEIVTALGAIDGMRELLRKLNPARMTTKEVRTVFDDVGTALESFQLGSARILGVLNYGIEQGERQPANEGNAVP